MSLFTACLLQNSRHNKPHQRLLATPKEDKRQHLTKDGDGSTFKDDTKTRMESFKVTQPVSRLPT